MSCVHPSSRLIAVNNSAVKSITLEPTKRIDAYPWTSLLNVLSGQPRPLGFRLPC
jgi:hypothetical protein